MLWQREDNGKGRVHERLSDCTHPEVGQKRGSYSQIVRPSRCPDPEIIALRMLMINQAQEVSGRFPASLIYMMIVSPSPAVPSTPMPLPSRSTSAGRPAALDTAQLPCSPLA
jgi:hypothetical protein